MFECPSCGFEGEFLDYGAKPRKNSLCPQCKSLERHRGIYLYLSRSGLLKEDSRILYVDPDKPLLNALRKCKNINVDAVDIDPNHRDIDYVMDITRTNYPQDCFDLIICYDVLEYISSENDALEEMSRILKVGGKLIIKKPTVETTKIIQKPTGTKNIYEHGKKYRANGLDVLKRLEWTNYDADVVTFTDLAENGANYSLLEGEGIIVARKK